MSSELQRQLARLKPGDHVCPIYESVAEKMAVAIPFVQEGLARGERCIYISDDRAIDAFARAIADAGVDVDQELGRGALRLLTERDAYLLSGEFQPRAMVAFLRQTEAEALAVGYRGLRYAGDATWEMGSAAGRERWIEYESLLNQFLEDSRTVILCQYDRRRFGPDWILDALRTHPVAVLGDQVCPNPYFEPPEWVLQREPRETFEFRANGADWWIQQLKKARAAERDRERMMEELDAERGRFEALLRQMPSGVAVVEAPSGKLILANAQLAVIFRHAHRAIADIQDYEKYNGFHPDGRPYRAEQWPLARSVLIGEEVVGEEIAILRGDGSLGMIRVNSTPIRDRTGRIIAAVANFYDITDQKVAREGLQRHTAQLQALATASLKINSTRSPTGVAQAVTEAARHLIGAHQSITGLSHDANWAQAIQSVSLSEKYAAWRDYDERPDRSGIYSLVCERNRPMRLTQAELEAHPRWRAFGAEAARHPPMRGWLAAPLVGRDGRNLGLIQLSDKYEGEFTADDEAILIQLAQVASVAIENAWLYEQVRAGQERMQSLSRQLLEVQEFERRHLARELHDEVGQNLTGLRLLLRSNADLTSDEAKIRFEQARGVVDELLGRIRGLSFDLRPAALDQLGLLPALLGLFERYTEQSSVLVDFKHRGVEGRFPPRVETTAYRIVQEALTNVARHAGVGEVTVQVWAAEDLLSLQIEDRGCGFDPEVALATPRSGGLAGMQERVMLLDGLLTIESRPAGGTLLTAELPLRGP